MFVQWDARHKTFSIKKDTLNNYQNYKNVRDTGINIKLTIRDISRPSILMLTVPIALAAFTHFWNPIGFPSIYLDENTYLRRAIVVLEGNGPVDKSSVYPPYDHPFLGQIFLASVFKIVGYPDLFIHSSPKGDVHSIEMLYFVPRVLMGALAVVDTFFIYKIAERRYNKNIALIASVLFAVMPMTWLLKMIMLESIQLPFILSAILFAIYLKKRSVDDNKDKEIAITLLSGICVGLAILTKMPAITIIPLGAFLVYTNTKELKLLGLWLIPVIFIPMIWPVYALSVGDFKNWLDGIYLQTHRGEAVYKPVPLSASIRYLFEIDPLLMILASGAIIFAAIKRDLFILLWSIPLLVFFYFVHSQFFILTPILPAFCVATAKMIDYLSNIVSKRKNIQQIVSLTTISAIGIFALISITSLITTNLNSAYIQAVAFVAKFLSSSNYNGAISNNNNNSSADKIAVVSEDRYYWIPQKILHEDQYYKVWDGLRFSKSEKAQNVLFVIDDPVKYWLTSQSHDMMINENVRNLQTVYDSTFPMVEFEKNKYSSTNGDWNPTKIQIRTNRTSDFLLNSSAFATNIRNSTIIENGTQLNVIIPVSQIRLPTYGNDSLRSCDSVFKCAANVTTGWNDTTSFQLSTKTTNKDTWSSIYGKEIEVNPGSQYQLLTHMKLNRYAMQSHIAVEGSNNDNTSKSWYQITQCPSGTSGPLEWKEFNCQITIPAKTTKIRPVLNAGWSSQPGKQAVTLFDAIYMTKTSPINITTHANKTSSDSNNNLIPNADFVDFSVGRIVSSCQLTGDFDVQLSYKVPNESHWPNFLRLSLIAKNDNIIENNNNMLNGRQQIALDSLNLPHHVIGMRSTENTSTLNSSSYALDKLRMIRSGSSIIGYYYNNLSKWSPIQIGHANPLDVNIIVQIDTHGISTNQPIKIVFDDHILNKGRIVNCR